jgi:hypothetical protein
MREENCSDWILILGAFLVLVTLGKISLLAFLILLSVLSACAILGSSTRDARRPTDGVKKG